MTRTASMSSSHRHQARSRSRIRQPRELDPTVSESREPDEPLAYPYSFDLSAHHGCVNALQVCRSSRGRWLASGGDDTRVLLWDTFADFDQICPVAVYEGPVANIFSIDFTADGRRVLAAGLDSVIYIWDLEKSAKSLSKRPPKTSRFTKFLTGHSQSCRRVTCHPQEPESLLSASEDGTILIADLRSPSNKQLLRAYQEYSDVLWHPTDSNLFIASTSTTLKLYDRRVMSSNPYTNISRQLTTYTTNLIKPRPTVQRSRPEISSVCFNETGQLIGSMMSRWFPTIWSLDDPDPLAVLKTDRIIDEQDGQQKGFKDTCTIKHASFSNSIHSGNSRDVYFVAGSDDFRCYGWKLDSIEQLKESRIQINDTPSWLQQNPLSGLPENIAYGQNPITIPTTLNEPTFTLGGHRSIPNAILFHPIFPLICTSGVEKVIKIHSTQQLGHHRQAREPLARRTPSQVRRKVSRVEELVNDDEDDDRETLVLFDQLLLRNEDQEVDGLHWSPMKVDDDSTTDDQDDNDDETGSDESDF